MPVLASLHDESSCVDEAALAAWLSPGRRFPSVELVDAAAGMFVRDRFRRDQTPDALVAPDITGRFYAGSTRKEGRDFLVGVAAGVVSVRLLDHERVQHTAGISRKAVPTGRLVHDEETNTSRWVPSTPTRVVEDWSRKSRARMTRRLSELDYAPMFAGGAAPAMVTVTYPGQWQQVAPSGKACKRHLRMLMKRWRRRWGQEPPYLWKLEFQRRGAPHFHLFVVPAGQDPKAFRDWLSLTWAEIVGSDWCGVPCWERNARGDRRPCCERGRHVLAGTGVDYKEGVRARDPKRLAVYFTKHGGAAGGKEYQHLVPVEWRTPATGPGRFWGYVGLRRVHAEVYVNQETYVRVRRTLRRLARSRRLTREIVVNRGPQLLNVETGEIRQRRRTVRRRRKVPCASGGLAGGFLLLNDGPSLAARLARL